MVEIKDVRFGEIDVDGRTYYSDVAIFWDGKVEMVEKKHVFDINDLMYLLSKGANIIVIGTGIEGLCKIEQEAFDMAEGKGIDIYIEKSKKAAKLFNLFAKSGEKVAAIIHTTG